MPVQLLALRIYRLCSQYSLALRICWLYFLYSLALRICRLYSLALRICRLYSRYSLTLGISKLYSLYSLALRICRLYSHFPTKKKKRRPVYDSASDGKASVLKKKGVWITSWLPLLHGPLWPGNEVSALFLSTSQIDLLKNYLYSMGTCAKNETSSKKQYKNVIMNVQLTRFINLLAQNNTRSVDVPKIELCQDEAQDLFSLETIH